MRTAACHVAHFYIKCPRAGVGRPGGRRHVSLPPVFLPGGNGQFREATNELRLSRSDGVARNRDRGSGEAILGAPRADIGRGRSEAARPDNQLARAPASIAPRSEQVSRSRKEVSHSRKEISPSKREV